MKKQATKLSQDAVHDILMHPEFPFVLQFIEEHFESSTHITEINTDAPSEAVHAEVIARKCVEKDLKQLFANFEQLKANFHHKRQSYE